MQAAHHFLLMRGRLIGNDDNGDVIHDKDENAKKRVEIFRVSFRCFSEIQFFSKVSSIEMILNDASHDATLFQILQHDLFQVTL